MSWTLVAVFLSLGGFLTFVYLSADVLALLYGVERLPKALRIWTDAEPVRRQLWRLPGVLLALVLLQGGMTFFAFSPPREFGALDVALLRLELVLVLGWTALIILVLRKQHP